MNQKRKVSPSIPEGQLDQFKEQMARLVQCCQERTQYQSERFGLPDAELRCLLLFGGERYLTAKGIAMKMNVAKSRVSKVVGGLVKKGLVQRVKDPEDSRYNLLTLTAAGQEKYNEISKFNSKVHREILAMMPPEQRRALLSALDALGSSMESVKDMMD